MTSKVWEAMNDLEMVTSKICSAREIIDAAIDRIQEHQYDKAEMMMSAAYEFLEYYLQEFDDKFKLAWQETVVKQKEEEDDAWEAVNREKEYYQGKTSLTCDKDDHSPECKGAWNSFWEENYYSEEYKGSTVSSVQYTEEEMNAMCDKAASDEEKEKCREYNVREAEYYDKRRKLDMNYPEAVASGWSMTDDGIWMPPQKEDKVVKWQLPVEVDGPSGEYFVSFPDDLLEAADLEEDDTVEWIDQGDGSYLLRKVTKTVRDDEC
jgi:hypothetical protein